MAKLNVDDVWEEMSRAEFENNEPENDCDVKVLRVMHSAVVNSIFMTIDLIDIARNCEI